jgi:hypothetical protein
MLSLLTQPQNRTFSALPCKGDDQKQAPVWQRVLGEVVRQEVHALIDAGRLLSLDFKRRRTDELE